MVTTKPLLNKRFEIASDHPIRGEFASQSTYDSHSYYSTLRSGIECFDEVLRRYGLRFRHIPDSCIFQEEGRAFLTIDGLHDGVGHAAFTWCRMPSGSYKLIGYIA
jgi:hypothetical protein